MMAAVHRSQTREGKKVCEFTVELDGEAVYKGAVHVKVEGARITVKDVLGVTKVFENCKIMEVDVGSERLILSRSQ
jgi:predicted RNA-binding protein